jgi:uncharacterized phage infection (PIP) family protein YhgE
VTSEERLDRWERIAMLMARAGLRVRREQNEKINIIIDAQIKHEDRFAQNEERFAKLAESQKLTDERFKQLAESQKELAESQKELAESQKLTDQGLNALIDIVRRDRNGGSS